VVGGRWRKQPAILKGTSGKGSNIWVVKKKEHKDGLRDIRYLAGREFIQKHRSVPSGVNRLT